VPDHVGLADESEIEAGCAGRGMCHESVGIEPAIEVATLCHARAAGHRLKHGKNDRIVMERGSAVPAIRSAAGQRNAQAALCPDLFEVERVAGGNGRH